MKKDVIFIGGGGHSLVCADIINQNKNLTLAGFVDKEKDVPLSKLGFEYLGNDQNLEISENQSIYIPSGARHRLSNLGENILIIIEIQTGTYLGEDDIIRFEDKYGR